MGIRGEIYTTRASSGNRTYFFNVKENRNGDLFLNVVESKKHGESGFERHQIVVFEEDLLEFVDEFNKAVEFMKARTGESDSKRPRPRSRDRGRFDDRRRSDSSSFDRDEDVTKRGDPHDYDRDQERED